MEHPTDGKPKVNLLRVANIGVGISVPFLDVFRPSAAHGAPVRAVQGGWRAPRRRPRLYKGSAMAKRATRRGGNPARTGLPGPAPASRR